MKKRIKHHIFHTTKRTGAFLFMALFALGGAYLVSETRADTGVPIEIRAKGDTGEERVELLIKDKRVAQWNLTTEFKTYTSVYSETVNDKDIKVAFVNDGRTSANQDKNVTVDWARVNGNTFQAETNNVYSTGTWSRDSGCAPGYKSSDRIHCGGFMQFSIGSAGVLELGTKTVDIRVRALGATGEERVELSIKGVTVQSWNVDRTYKTFAYTHDQSVSSDDIEVKFVNDGRTSSGADKNLRVDFIEVNGQRYQTEAPEVFSVGSWSRSNGCGEGNKQSEWLHCNGRFAYNIGQSGTVEESPVDVQPVLNEGFPVSVRAQGSTGQEKIELRIDDRAVKSWTLSSAMATYSYSHDTSVADSDIKVAFVNDGRTSTNADKNVRVDYIVVDGKTMQSEASNVYSTGTYTRDIGCGGGNKRSEWLHCSGYLQYTASEAEEVAEEPAPVIPPSLTISDPATEPEPEPTPPPTTGNGRYTAAEIVASTLGSGPPWNTFNGAPGSPWGLHDGPLKIPEWDFKHGPKPSSGWQKMGTGDFRAVEWRCAVFAQEGTFPSGDLNIEVRNAAYYGYQGGQWVKRFDARLVGTGKGAYLVGPGGTGDPYSNHIYNESIVWREVSPGVFRAPWKGSQLMHFWAGKRDPIPSNQTAELLTAEIRLVNSSGQPISNNNSNLLGQCGVDYYSGATHNSTKAPGPGIGKYWRLNGNWRPTLWVTPPPGVATSPTAITNWLNNNPAPVMSR
jgi:hypothetical protein